jgi:hypothetical protein
MDYPEKHLLSLGVQLGWVGKSFLPGSDLQFGNQYLDYQFDATQPNNENLKNVSVNSVNINAGLGYQVKLNYKSKLKIGINFNSLTTPNESFISAKNSNQLGVRYVSYAMLDYMVNNKIIVSPKVFYANQSRGEDINIGALGTYKFNNPNGTYLQAGAFHRIKDSAILMAGFGWQSVLLRASVDLTTSSLKDVKNIKDSGYNAPRAYEIGFIYTGLFKKHEISKLTVPCGIF